METMIKQIAAMSTLILLLVTFWFVFLVLGALGVDDFLQYFASLLITLSFVPVTWRFCLREAQLSDGDSNADRKD